MDLHPIINATGCVYYPDLGNRSPFACGEPNGGVQSAYVGRPLGLNLTVSDSDGSPINVTVWWDAQINLTTFVPEPSNLSAIQYFNVIPGGPKQPVNISTTWTYSSPGRPLGIYTGFHIYVNVTNSNGYDPFQRTQPCPPAGSYCFFDIIVAPGNTPPSMDGLQGSYSYRVTFPDWKIPEFIAKVTVTDVDDDPVVVTWDWGDGNVSVNRTGPALSGVFVQASHNYALALNATPQVYNFILNASLDDGVAGHNTTTSVSIQYYVGLDAPPSPIIVAPTGVERLVVGRNVTFTGILSDYEGDSMIYYWDFGDGKNTSYSAPVLNGSVSVNHTYAAPGNYTALLWATDGLDKRSCWGTDCSRTHWVNVTKAVYINPNGPPVASLTISSNPYAYGKPAGFSIATYDLDGDAIVVTWDFGDNATAVNRSAEGSNQHDFLQYHNYSIWGDPSKNYIYNVTVWVDDGQGHNISRETDIFIGSVNLPPVIEPKLFLVNNTARANETFRLEINVTDPENDSVRVTVDFGDGTSKSFSGLHNVTLSLNHSYAASRTYTINISATDDRIFIYPENVTAANATDPANLTSISHNVFRDILVDVLPPPNVATTEPWTWWDYTTLAAVLALPAVYFTRAAYLRRQERREE